MLCSIIKRHPSAQCAVFAHPHLCDILTDNHALCPRFEFWQWWQAHDFVPSAARATLSASALVNNVSVPKARHSPNANLAWVSARCLSASRSRAFSASNIPAALFADSIVVSFVSKADFSRAFSLRSSSISSCLNCARCSDVTTVSSDSDSALSAHVLMVLILTPSSVAFRYMGAPRSACISYTQHHLFQC